MKQWVIAGVLAGSMAFGAAAQQAASQQPAAEKPAGQSTAKPASGHAGTAEKSGAQTAKPATRSTRTRREAAGSADQPGDRRAPNTQPTTAADPSAPDAAMALGSVRIPRAVKADGKPLAAGTYQVRLTPETSKPDAVGASEKLERWVEFVQKGQVAGREVVSIVPQGEAKLVQKDAPPPNGGSKIQMLKGNDYLRVWINKGGNYYLIHLVPA